MMKMTKDTSLIPKGMYCYVPVVPNFLGIGKLVIKKCPYWSLDEKHEKQDNGYCAYLEKGDWELCGGLLWDACKECGINMEDD